MDRKKLIVQPPVAPPGKRSETFSAGVEEETPRRPAATPPLTVPPPDKIYKQPSGAQKRKRASGSEQRKRKQMAEFRENAEKILRYRYRR